MTRQSQAAPRQDASTFQANDSALKVIGGDSTVKPVKDCSDRWKLTVNVTGQVDARKTALTGAEVEVEWSDSMLDAPPCRKTAGDKASTETLEDKGTRQGTCRAKAAGWYLEAEQPVTLNDGDDKVIELVLKPAVWVAFKVVDHMSGDLVGDIHLKSNLPVLGERLIDTVADAILDIEHEDLRPGMECTMLDLSHDTIVYEVVGAIASA